MLSTVVGDDHHCDVRPDMTRCVLPADASCLHVLNAEHVENESGNPMNRCALMGVFTALR